MRESTHLRTLTWNLCTLWWVVYCSPVSVCRLHFDVGADDHIGKDLAFNQVLKYLDWFDRSQGAWLWIHLYKDLIKKNGRNRTINGQNESKSDLKGAEIKEGTKQCFGGAFISIQEVFKMKMDLDIHIRWASFGATYSNKQVVQTTQRPTKKHVPISFPLSCNWPPVFKDFISQDKTKIRKQVPGKSLTKLSQARIDCSFWIFPLSWKFPLSYVLGLLNSGFHWYLILING